MPNIPRLLIENACYHLIARGNQKQKVFLGEKDYHEYLERLKAYKKKFDFRLYGYCLMPNHVHLLGQIEVTGNLSKFMQGIALSYALHFNNKYAKVGHLWQGRFKNKVIAKDQYLVDCINYIELNPVRAEIVKAPHEYIWSSYKERVLGSGLKILNKLTL